SFTSDVKSHGLTVSGHGKLGDLSTAEESGFPRVAVKCVEVWRNTSGEGDSLVCNGRWGATAWVADRIRYTGSDSRRRCELGVRGFPPLSTEGIVIRAAVGECS